MRCCNKRKHQMKVTLDAKHLAGARLLLPLSALLSLAYGGYFLAGISVADANEKEPIFVAGEAIANRVRSASEFKPASVGDVVAKALAFKALLSTAQQQVLEQTYTPMLARRWSNLP